MIDILKKILTVSACVFGITFCLAGTLVYFETFVSNIRDGVDEIVRTFQSHKHYKQLDKRIKNAYERSMKDIKEKEN